MAKKRGRPRRGNPTWEELYEARKAEYAPKKTSWGWKILGIEVPTCNELSVMLLGFRIAEDPEAKEFFFWEVADRLWNKDPDDKKFRKNKWSWRIIHHCCRENWLAIGGSASSGKSYVLAGWALISWYSDPANTLVLVTSTDLKGARKRIYGAIKTLLSSIPNPPCKIQDSIGVIPYKDASGKIFDTRGIQIVTADKSKSAESMGKLIGAKAPNLILIADEHGEMGPNVTAAAKGNLAKNDRFQMISMSNPASRFDPFGDFAEPATGWESVDVLRDVEWKTKHRGRYIRLNSEESPNIDMTPNPEYPTGEHTPGVVNQDHLDADLYVPNQDPEEVRKTRNFMRFHSAIFSDSDQNESVFSESEFIRSGALSTTKLHNTTLVAGCDVAYSEGGDKTVMILLEEGWDQYGQHAVQLKDMVYLNEDITDKETPRTLQIAQKIKNTCIKWGVAPENFGIDASSGAGQGISDMLRLEWTTNAFLRVQFGGRASERRIAPGVKTRGCDRYKNRSSELYFAAKGYLSGRQIYGITDNFRVIVQQMCARNCYEPTKGEKGLIYQVEKKKDFKSRTGYSPDEQDAFLVALETALVRRMFSPQDPVARKDALSIHDFMRTRKTHRSFSADVMGFCGNL